MYYYQYTSGPFLEPLILTSVKLSPNRIEITKTFLANTWYIVKGLLFRVKKVMIEKHTRPVHLTNTVNMKDHNHECNLIPENNFVISKKFSALIIWYVSQNAEDELRSLSLKHKGQTHIHNTHIRNEHEAHKDIQRPKNYQAHVLNLNQ